MTGIGFLAPQRGCSASSPVPAWPDLVLYLDLPQDAVPERNHGQVPARQHLHRPRLQRRRPRIFPAARRPEIAARGLA